MSNIKELIVILFITVVIGVFCLLSVYAVEHKLDINPEPPGNNQIQETIPIQNYTIIHCPNTDCSNHIGEPFHTPGGGFASYKISSISGSYKHMVVLCELCGACWSQEFT